MPASSCWPSGPTRWYPGRWGAFWQPTGGLRRLRAEEFRAFAEPGFAKVAFNMRAQSDGGGTLLVTETRVQATDEAARRHFALYWRPILPGSALIRRGWLRAIRRRALRS